MFKKNTNGSYWYSINAWFDFSEEKPYEVVFHMNNIKLGNIIKNNEPMKWFKTLEEAEEYKNDMIKKIQLYNTFPENTTWIENYDNDNNVLE